MTKAVSICLVICILTVQLWWRPDSVRTETEDAVVESQSQVDNSSGHPELSDESLSQCVDSDGLGDANAGETDSETGTSEDQPLNPILARAVVAEKSGRLTRSFNLSRVLALSNCGQVVDCPRNSRGDHAEDVAVAARCRTSSLLALSRATRPHAPPLA